jgi:hypothetical protein
MDTVVWLRSQKEIGVGPIGHRRILLRDICATECKKVTFLRAPRCKSIAFCLISHPCDVSAGRADDTSVWNSLQEVS